MKKREMEVKKLYSSFPTYSQFPNYSMGVSFFLIFITSVL